MGDVVEELRVGALNRATASKERVEQREFSDASVHAIRAGAKRLRALWRLLRTGIHDDVFAAANARLRDSNRRLAPARDVHVAQKTIDKLLGKCKRKKNRKALRAFRETLPRVAKRPRVFASSASALEAAYRDEVTAWRTLAIDAPDQAIVYSGIRRSYRQAQKRAEKAIASGRAVQYHRWRQWTKYLLYQLEALEPRLLDWQRHQLAMLDRLGSELGKHNDLQSLRRRASAAELSPSKTERVLRVIDARAERHRERCHRLYERLYARRPEIFAASIARAVTAPERMGLPLVNIAGD